MLFSMETWLLPAIAAGSSSYLICLLWERFRHNTAPNGMLAAYLAVLSFFMGAISAYYRHAVLACSLENSVIIMFLVGASTTYIWLLLRRFFRNPNRRDKV
jgi:hypothetical protein